MHVNAVKHNANTARYACIWFGRALADAGIVAKLPAYWRLAASCFAQCCASCGCARWRAMAACEPLVYVPKAWRTAQKRAEARMLKNGGSGRKS